MRTCLLFLSLLWPAAAVAGLVVSFPPRDRYTDAGSDPIEVERNLKALGSHLERLGERYLAPDETLRIEVIDVDLAGEVPTMYAHQNMRILKGTADWPLIKVRYTLEKGGRTETRQESIADMNYLRRPRTHGTETLAYEKRMLEGWFRERFAPNTVKPSFR